MATDTTANSTGTSGGGALAGQRITVRTGDGAALRVTVTGAPDAAATVVFAHGWTLHGDVWRAQVAALVAGGVRVVTYDHRGHGGSSAGRAAPWTIDLLGDDLADVIDAVAPSGRVLLCGHSMGGMTIMALAASRPELFGSRVAGVVLVGTSAGSLVPSGRGLPPAVRIRSAAQTRFFAFGQRHPQFMTRGRRILPGPGRPGHLRLVRRGLFGPQADPRLVHECAQMLFATPMSTVCGFFPALAGHDKVGTLAALAAVPVHIVVGELDRLTPLAHSKALAAELPDATLHVERDCGHMVLTERPESVTTPLRELCAGL
ncbi:alpha/beta hydrolase [Streptomyces sp. SID3343]|uniref:alpha/beta fold hydrolase n=1 Tax=Streptomyces sp. SID3343 TaxID=2690260 RepID=UPI00136D29D7|nr:alpha/beta hydrolase [Streptomyces sp. SID3343]MYV97682.1 alpha/beta fold hydrolase [Streptomyces sp. SID3343]